MQNKKAIRAVQFQPFDALKGFKEEINKRNKIVVEKRELSNEYLEDMNNIVSNLKIGMIVEIVYYENEEYIKVKGVLTRLDLDNRFLSVVKTKIYFDKIVKVNCDEVELKML